MTRPKTNRLKQRWDLSWACVNLNQFSSNSLFSIFLFQESINARVMRLEEAHLPKNLQIWMERPLMGFLTSTVHLPTLVPCHLEVVLWFPGADLCPTPVHCQGAVCQRCLSVDPLCMNHGLPGVMFMILHLILCRIILATTSQFVHQRTTKRWGKFLNIYVKLKSDFQAKESLLKKKPKRVSAKTTAETGFLYEMDDEMTPVCYKEVVIERPGGSNSARPSPSPPTRPPSPPPTRPPSPPLNTHCSPPPGPSGNTTSSSSYLDPPSPPSKSKKDPRYQGWKHFYERRMIFELMGSLRK